MLAVDKRQTNGATAGRCGLSQSIWTKGSTLTEIIGTCKYTVYACTFVW